MDIKQWRITAIVAGTTTFISILVSVGIIRFCVASDFSLPLSPRTLICGGDLNAGRVGFKRLTSENMFVVSAIAESKEYSIDRDNAAAKLIDGKKETLAAPANKQLDYQFTFIEPQHIRQTIITWGDYGTIEKYIASWKLEVSDDGKIWKTIISGNSPQSKETIINKGFDASFVRLAAQSPQDWIGIYEVELIGRPL